MTNFDVVLYFIFAKHKSGCPCCEDSTLLIKGPFISKEETGNKMNEINGSHDERSVITAMMYTDDWELVMVETTIKDKHSREVYP